MSDLGYGSAADYTINVVGSRYIATPRSGNTYIPPDTSLSTLWDDINSAVTGPVVEFGRGDFTLDSTLVVTANDTVIRGQGPQGTYIKNDSAIDTDMVEMSTYYHNFALRGLTLDGNRDNNTAGKGIYIDVADATYGGGSIFWGWHAIEDIAITECDEDGFYIRTVAGLNTQGYMNNFRVWNNDGGTSSTQGSFIRVFDYWIGGSGQNNISSLRFNGGASNHINTVYFGGGGTKNLLMEGGLTDTSNGSIFTNNRFDHATQNAVDITDNQKRHIFTGNVFTNFSQDGTTDTHPCINLDGDSGYISFVGNFFGHTNVITGDRWTNVMTEGGSTDYNYMQGNILGQGAIKGGNAEHFTENASGQVDLGAGSNSLIQYNFKPGTGDWTTY